MRYPSCESRCDNGCGFISQSIDWSAANDSLDIDRTVEEVLWAEPGYAAGLKMLEDFCEKRLKIYSTQRNDPNAAGLSNLSPWYHFGKDKNTQHMNDYSRPQFHTLVL